MNRKLFLMIALISSVLLGRPVSAAERVNLWPLYMQENGRHDFIWPLGQYKSAKDWRFFPVINDRSTFCIFPEVWLGSNSFAVLPLWASNDLLEGTLCPVLWWNTKDEHRTMNSVFPLYYYSNHEKYENLTFWAACGLGGYLRRYGNIHVHWLAPLYCAWGDGDFFSIPYSRSSHYSGSDEAYFCGLFGRSVATNGAMTAHWVFPLYGKTDRKFISLPYFEERHASGRTEWLSLPLLSGGESGPAASKAKYLLALAGYERTAESFESWCAPFYYANDKGTLITPVYGQTAKASWGLPGWYRDEHVFASPLWYHHTDAQGEIDRWVLPWLLSGGYAKDGERKTAYVLNAAGTMTTDKGYSASWCLPFYFWDNEGTFVTPLYGRNKASQWCFPLWYSDKGTLYSAFWCHERDDDGRLESWAIPPLLSGGKIHGNGSREVDFLLGLGGATWGAPDGARSSWAFPFYYEDSKGKITTPLFGKDEDCHWILPLYYSDRDSFASLPYAHWRNQYDKSDTYVVLPILSGCKKYDSGRFDTSALLLYGHSTDAQGQTRRDYLLPLYHYNGENDNFTSLLYGRHSCGTSTNHWWATPLVGTRTGSKMGGWFFPFFNRTKDASYDDDLARLDSPTLPEDILISDRVDCWTNNKTKVVQSYTNKVASVQVNSHIRGSVLLGSDFDKSVWAFVASKDYTLSATSKRGNRLVFNRETERKVEYDIATRQKKEDRASSETTVLGGLFTDERRQNRTNGSSYARTRVLWKLWDREERDGHLTIDAFPGFAYESKTNGYSNTSFLWRFYRYERKANGEKNLDLLFVPILRGKNS